MSIFKGAGVAIVTPMKDNEDVNYEKLEELINWQIDQGTDAIIIAGTTGESSTLTVEEHSQVIRAAVDFTKHRIPVIAGSGSNCTREAIFLTQEAEAAGADGILAVTPYYNKCTQDGLVRYYSEIAECTKLPIIMYNVPGRTGCNILPETAASTGIPVDVPDRRQDRPLFRRRRNCRSVDGNRSCRCDFCMV